MAPKKRLSVEEMEDLLAGSSSGKRRLTVDQMNSYIQRFSNPGLEPKDAMAEEMKLGPRGRSNFEVNLDAARDTLGSFGQDIKDFDEVTGIPSAVMTGLDYVDRHIGQPMRRDIEAAQKGKTDEEVADEIARGVPAPSMKGIMQNAGLSGIPEDIPLEQNLQIPEYKRMKYSPAGLAGSVVDFGLAPANIGAPMVGKALSTTANLVPEYLAKKAKRFKDLSEDLAGKAVIGRSAKHVRESMDMNSKNPGGLPQKVENIRGEMRDILEEPGALGWLDNTRTVGMKAEPIRAHYGDKIREVVEEIDKFHPAPIEVNSIIKDIEDYAQKIPDLGTGTEAKSYLLREASKLKAKYARKPEEIERLRDAIVNKELKRNPSMSKDEVLLLTKRAENEARNRPYNPKINFGEAHENKQYYQYDPKAADASVSKEDAVNYIRALFKDAQEKAADELHIKSKGLARAEGHKDILASPKFIEMVNNAKKTQDLTGRYKEFKTKYKAFKHASNASTHREGRDRALRFGLSPSEIYSAGTGALVGAAATGDISATTAMTLFAIAASKFINHSGASLASRLANSVYKILSTNPEAQARFAGTLANAAEKGAQPFIMAHYLLMKKDPEYKALFEENK